MQRIVINLHDSFDNTTVSAFVLYKAITYHYQWLLSVDPGPGSISNHYYQCHWLLIDIIGVLLVVGLLTSSYIFTTVYR